MTTNGTEKRPFPNKKQDTANDGERPLPDGWTWTPFGELFEIQGGSQPPKDTFIYEPKEGYIRLLQIRDFGDKPVPTYIPINQARKTCEKQDVLIARYGASLGRILTGMEGAYNVAMAKVIFDHSLINSRYIFYLLQTPIFQTPIHMISRSAQNGFNKGDVYPIELPIAPLPEQERIVAEIEKQFTRLDQAVASLRRLQGSLARYKASVLKAACEGRLVPQNPADESASQLLERILAERRAQWQAAHPGKKYKEPVGVEDTAVLSELPEGWVWANVDQLCDVKYGLGVSLRKTQPDDPMDIPVIRIPNVTEFGSMDLSLLKYYPLEEKEREKLLLNRGDILFNWRNAPKWIGRSAVFNQDGEYVNASFLLRLRPIVGGYSNFVSLYLNFLRVTGYFMTRVDNAVNQANYNGSKTKQVDIAIPPLAEQERIVAEVERRLSVAAATEQTITANLARAERLRQSILHRAFTGQL